MSRLNLLKQTHQDVVKIESILNQVIASAITKEQYSELLKQLDKARISRKKALYGLITGASETLASVMSLVVLPYLLLLGI